jgi:hypothetical protein
MLRTLIRVLSLKLIFMNPIVVPVDFNPPSLNAARYAADLAVSLTTDLQLLLVRRRSADKLLTPAVTDEILHSGLEGLQSLAAELGQRTAAKIKIGWDQRTGKPGEQIKAFCLETSASLLVASEPVDRRISVPQLIVPDQVHFHPVHTIAIACDQDDILSGMHEQMPFLGELNSRLGCQFELVHVIRDDGGSIGQMTQDYNDWKTRPSFLSAKLNFVRQEAPQNGIREYLKTHQADWLIVLPKRHGWIEFHDSEAKHISQTRDLPVLSLYE